MREQLLSVLRIKGISPIIKSIDLTIKDLKALEYDRSEILETLQAYKGLDHRIDLYIKERV
jgi:hypothetical protein